MSTSLPPVDDEGNPLQIEKDNDDGDRPSHGRKTPVTARHQHAGHRPTAILTNVYRDGADPHLWFTPTLGRNNQLHTGGRGCCYGNHIIQQHVSIRAPP